MLLTGPLCHLGNHFQLDQGAKRKDCTAMRQAACLPSTISLH
jgi:hypothetical protein